MCTISVSSLIPRSLKARVKGYLGPRLSVAQKRRLRQVVASEPGIGRLRDARTARSAEQALSRPVTEPVLRHLEGQRYLGTVVTSFDAQAAMAEHLSMVVRALTAAEVTHAVIEAATMYRPQVVVEAGDREAVLAALRAQLGDQPVYLRPLLPTVGAPQLLAAELPATAVGFQLFRCLCSPDGAVLGVADLACEVQLWSRAEHELVAEDNGMVVPKGSLVRPGLRNRWLDVIEPDRWQPEPGTRLGVACTTLPGVPEHHISSFEQPIDVVYTWVDGNDPAWLERKRAALAAQDPDGLHAFAANDSRFVPHDELRHSLRSIEMYASWVRTVYLVTDQQVPDWLAVDHPQVRVVDHRDIFTDPSVLPTFNSHAIESQLHHIDGLAEHYLYLNDDFFFGRPVRPETFFHANGIAKFFLSEAKLGLAASGIGDMPVMSAGKNNRDLLASLTGRHVTNKLKHVPQATRRSVVQELEDRLPEAFAATARARFRTTEDISVASALSHHYAYATGRAVPSRIRYLYADIALASSSYRLDHALQRRQYDTICLNDHDSRGGDPLEQSRRVTDFLSAYYPLPSRFERG